MGEWITGAAINVVGSISINFGTNLLKLGHNQRERQALVDADESEDKVLPKKPVTQFQSWRIGMVVFSFGNILNFISFGYAAQSLLAALGSVQLVSNVFFANLMLNEIVTKRIIMATLFIMAGNGFLVAFGNHQSVIYTHEELLASYKDHVYLVYCIILLLIVVLHHTIYRRGRQLAASGGEDPVGAWGMLLPYTYAVVSGAVGSHSVLFAKSLSILLRSTMEGDNQLDGWFAYLVFFLFAGTASFWMARLNNGLAMFDSILIIPMLQIVWTFFSIFTGFIYFKEYRVFGHFRAAMFGVGALALFVGMSLLAPQAPQGSKGSVTKTESDSETEFAPLISDAPSDHRELNRTLAQHVFTDAAAVGGQAESACRMTVGLGQDCILSSSVLSIILLLFHPHFCVHHWRAISFQPSSFQADGRVIYLTTVRREVRCICMYSSLLNKVQMVSLIMNQQEYQMCDLYLYCTLFKFCILNSAFNFLFHIYIYIHLVSIQNFYFIILCSLDEIFE